MSQLLERISYDYMCSTCILSLFNSIDVFWEVVFFPSPDSVLSCTFTAVYGSSSVRWVALEPEFAVCSVYILSPDGARHRYCPTGWLGLYKVYSLQYDGDECLKSYPIHYLPPYYDLVCILFSHFPFSDVPESIQVG